MTQEEFEKRIADYKERYRYPESISVKGAMAFMARMCVTYPELAKVWYDGVPKVTMD